MIYNTIGQVRTLYVQKDRIKDIYLAYMLIFNIQYSNWMEIRFIRFETYIYIYIRNRISFIHKTIENCCVIVNSDRSECWRQSSLYAYRTRPRYVHQEWLFYRVYEI